VKNYYGRTYFDEFMPTYLRGAVFFETQCSFIINNIGNNNSVYFVIMKFYKSMQQERIQNIERIINVI